MIFASSLQKKKRLPDFTVEGKESFEFEFFSYFGSLIPTSSFRDRFESLVIVRITHISKYFSNGQSLTDRTQTIYTDNTPLWWGIKEVNYEKTKI